ncbi:MAG: LysE family transporter [Polyangiaceae bacterium]|nr:LysE family transporter [Polyangiaceae bacterium]
MRLFVVTCLVALVFGYVGSIPLAGPIAVLMLSRAAQRRFGEALRIGFGAAMAEGIYAGLAFWGFTTFLARQPIVLPLSRAMAAIILSAVGGWFVFWRPGTAKPDTRAHMAGTVLLGFSISALNPTLLLTWSAAVAFLYSKGFGGQPAFVAVPFGVCASAGVALWIACLVRLLERYGGRLPRGAMAALVRIMGLGLVGLGAWSWLQLAGFC